MSNFTDFNLLEQVPEVNLFYAAAPEDLKQAEIVIVPGSKNTISDMLYLHKQGMAKAIKNAHKNKKAVYGICGGFQMMGNWIKDPNHIEGKIEVIPGLGILPVETTITEEKTTEQCRFIFQENMFAGEGYEIHMGETVGEERRPVCLIDGEKEDGYFLNAKTWGTYIHGIFDNLEIVNSMLSESGKKLSSKINFKQFKEEQYDKLAGLIRQNANMEYIYKSMQL